MSDGQKVKAEEAREKVEIIRELLESQCRQIVIAGSLRRGKALVGDAEIVALPKYAPNLLARLDRMVAEQLIVKAAYGEKRLTRWGDKYRGFVYQGLRIELFLAEPDNWG
jgi:DNA polymerase/3'-5' exonuclease PolX